MKKILQIAAIFCLLCFACGSPENQTNIYDLRVEYMKNPIGIEVGKPRFSWKMESNERGASQTAYRIIVSEDEHFKKILWNSGEVKSDQSVHIVYEGAPLRVATRFFGK